jgi:hypothetical protein
LDFLGLNPWVVFVDKGETSGGDADDAVSTDHDTTIEATVIEAVHGRDYWEAEVLCAVGPKGEPSWHAATIVDDIRADFANGFSQCEHTGQGSERIFALHIYGEMFAAVTFNICYAFTACGDDPTLMAGFNIQAIGVYGATFDAAII